jgi:putative peptidoglycan lipid II flippase
VVVGALVLLGVAFAAPLVDLIAPGLGEHAGPAARLTRLMMPFLLLVSLAAVAMGILNAQGRFTAPALAPALFNVGSLAVGLGLWLAGWPPERAVVGWALGTLLGGLLQLVTQLPSLGAAGSFPIPGLSLARLRDPGLRRIGRLMAASVVGLSATQVNILVNTIFASHEAGAVTWLQMAFRLMQLPLGVFGVAIATVAGAGVAQAAAARDLPEVRRTLGSALRLVAFLNVPSAVGLAVVAGPIVSLIYEHGRFGPADAAATAEALACYALGLYAYSGVKVLAPAFYALDRARVPVIGSILGMATNVVLNLALYPVLGFRGVALGTSLAAGANFLVLLVAWRRTQGGLGGTGVVAQLGRVLVASAVLALVAWGTAAALAAVVPGHGLGRQAVVGLGPVVAGAAAYFAMARLLGIAELGELAAALRRRRQLAAG